MYMYSISFHLTPQGILYTSTLFLPSSSCCSLFLASSCLFCRLLSFFRSLLNCLWLKYLKDHLRWLNTVFAHALAVAIRCMQKYWKNTHMLLIQWSFYMYLLTACTICAIFLHNWMQCINSFISLLLQRYVRKLPPFSLICDFGK